MILCILQDVQSSFASNWARVANLPGLADIHIGDRFREQGVGPGGEELEVAGVDISPVGGFSRLFFNRGANATKPDVHRLGAVFEQVGIKALVVDPAYQPLRETINGTDAVAVTAEPFSEGVIVKMAGAPDEFIPAKRGRGRPPGSKNKARDEVKLPVGFE